MQTYSLQKKTYLKFYTTAKLLSITCQVELIDKKKIAKVALNKNIKVFVIHVSFLSLELKRKIYLSKKAQIALLLDKKVTILAEYLNFANVFFRKGAKILLKCITINEHTIKLVDNKQPLYRPFYSLKLVKLKTLNIYIKTNPVNSFIYFLEFSTDTFIFFIWKLDGSVHFCVDYRGLNNLIIKILYLLFLISEFLH